MTDQPAPVDDGPDEVANDDLPVEPDLTDDQVTTDDIAADDIPEEA